MGRETSWNLGEGQWNPYFKVSKHVVRGWASGSRAGEPIAQVPISFDILLTMRWIDWKRSLWVMKPAVYAMKITSNIAMSRKCSRTYALQKMLRLHVLKYPCVKNDSGRCHQHSCNKAVHIPTSNKLVMYISFSLGQPTHLLKFTVNYLLHLIS